MADELFNYPIEPPPQSTTTSPRPKTSREATRKRRRKRHHHSTKENKENQERSQEEEEELQQQQSHYQELQQKQEVGEFLPSKIQDKDSQDLNQSNSNYRTGKIESNEEEEEIDEILYWTENGIKNPSILEKCNPDLLPSVIINLKDLRDQYIVNNEVDESCVADAALTEARKIHKKNLMRIATKSLRQELEQRLQEAEDALRDLEETCKYQEDRMNKDFAKESSDLTEKHRLETQKLIETWTSQPPPQSDEQIEIELGKTYSTRPKTSRKKNREPNDSTGQNKEDTKRQSNQNTNKQNKDIEKVNELIGQITGEKVSSQKKTNSNRSNKKVEDSQNKTKDSNEQNNDDASGRFTEEDDQEYNEETARKFRQYNKYSPQLRYLYDQADRYLRAKKYEESRAVQKRAKELEKIEVERNHIRMERDYYAAMEALQAKQADEIAIQEKAQNDRRKEYYHARDFDMNVAKNRIEKIKKELEATENPKKVWALHHRHDSELPLQNNQTQSQNQRTVYSSRGVYETTNTSSSVGKDSIYNKFNRINLPPLKSGRSSRRVIQNTQRSFKFNKGYVFT